MLNTTMIQNCTLVYFVALLLFALFGYSAQTHSMLIDPRDNAAQYATFGK